jgi:hypothetical protein
MIAQTGSDNLIAATSEPARFSDGPDRLATQYFDEFFELEPHLVDELLTLV